jgi:hypothetical protein
VATLFPGSNDTFTEPSTPASTSLSSSGSGTRNHYQHHQDLGDAVEAMQSVFTLVSHDHSASGTRPTAKLLQANTHQSVDTDSATTSIHHTLGTGANQAAQGSHAHASLYSALTHLHASTYAAISHTHTSGSVTDFSSAATTAANAAILVYPSLESTIVGYNDGWYDYTPTWTGVVAGFTFGNASISGKFRSFGGGTYMVSIRATVGSTTSDLGGTSQQWKFSLPTGVTVANSTTEMVGSARYYDGSAPNPGKYQNGSCIAVTNSNYLVAYSQNGSVGPTAPFAWAASDQILLTCMFQAQ